MKKRALVLTVLIGVIGGVYLWGLAPSVTPQGDAGELITVAYTLGVAHPPGYPLYTLLAHAFTKFPWNSVAWRVNLFSAVTHLVTLVLFWLVAIRLTKKIVISALGTVFLAFSYSFWLYSLVAEVFPLNDMLAVLLVYLLLPWLFKSVSADRNLVMRVFGLGVVMGLALSNHHTIVLLMPAAGYVILQNRPAWEKFGLWKLTVLVAVGAVGLLLGLSPYVYFFIRPVEGYSGPLWTNIRNGEDLWRMFVRADYGTFSLVPGYSQALAPFWFKGEQLLTYGRFLIDEFTLPGLILVLAGVAISFLVRRRLAIFLTLGFLVSGPLFFIYASFPYREYSGTGLEVMERFYLLPNLFVAIFLVLGLKYLAEWLGRWRGARLIFMVVMMGLIVHSAWWRFNFVSQRDNYLGRDLGRNILSGAPEKAVVLVARDIDVCTSLYMRYVEGYRTDVDLVVPNMSLPGNNYASLRITRPDFDWSYGGVASFGALVERNFGRAQFLLDDGKINIAGMTNVPNGLLAQVRRDADEVDFASTKKQIAAVLDGYVLPKPQRLSGQITLADRALLSNYVFMFVGLGQYCTAQKDYDCGARYYHSALDLEPNFPFVVYKLAQMEAQAGRCQEAQAGYLRVLQDSRNDGFIYEDLVQLAKGCFADEKLAQTYVARVMSRKAGVAGIDLKKL